MQDILNKIFYNQNEGKEMLLSDYFLSKCNKNSFVQIDKLNKYIEVFNSPEDEKKGGIFTSELFWKYSNVSEVNFFKNIVSKENFKIIREAKKRRCIK
ncbi:MAG: hypothetical protein ACRC0V_00170 [Fusobacteriaceae bacterium]